MVDFWLCVSLAALDTCNPNFTLCEVKSYLFYMDLKEAEMLALYIFLKLSTCFYSGRC